MYVDIYALVILMSKLAKPIFGSSMLCICVDRDVISSRMGCKTSIIIP